MDPWLQCRALSSCSLHSCPGQKPLGHCVEMGHRDSDWAWFGSGRGHTQVKWAALEMAVWAGLGTEAKWEVWRDDKSSLGSRRCGVTMGPGGESGRIRWVLGLLQPQGHLPSTRLCEGPGHTDLASHRLDSITLLTTDPEGPGPNMDTQTALETSPPMGRDMGGPLNTAPVMPPDQTLARDTRTSGLIPILPQPNWGTDRPGGDLCEPRALTHM